MINEQLECCLEEEVAYGCTPHDVLNALERLQTRIDQHKLDEPGEYLQTKPTAIWHSSLSSAWKVSMSLFREVSPQPPAQVVTTDGTENTDQPQFKSSVPSVKSVVLS